MKGNEGDIMYAAVNGHYDGTKIVLEENVPLSFGQKVKVILFNDMSAKKPFDLAQYQSENYGIAIDAHDYVRKLSNNAQYNDDISLASPSEKQLAFQRMQELRKISREYNLGDAETEIGNAISEKYGNFS